MVTDLTKVCKGVPPYWLTQQSHLLACAHLKSTTRQIGQLKPKVNTPPFATTANHLQLYYSPRVKILAFKAANKELIQKQEFIVLDAS